MKLNLITLVLALCCWTTAEAAGTLRCKGKIIQTGASAAYILKMCGAPERKLIKQSPARARTATGFSRVIGTAVSEEWIYDRGRGRFPVALEFYEGKVRRIDFLPKRS